MLSKYNECKKMFGNLITFSVLLSVFINCQACGASPLSGNAEGQLSPLKVNEASYQGGSNGGNQRAPSYENLLFRRYHGLGTDFAVRGYPGPFPDQGEIENNHGMEVKYFL